MFESVYITVNNKKNCDHVDHHELIMIKANNARYALLLMKQYYAETDHKIYRMLQTQNNSNTSFNKAGHAVMY